MKRNFLAGVSAVGLFLGAMGSQWAAAQGREPTVDERFRDANSAPADAEKSRLSAPVLNSPQSKLTRPTPAKTAQAAYLGVTFAGGDDRAVVKTVAPGSPAEQAGLQPNDLIETLQGRQVKKDQDVLDIVSKLRPGDVLDIGFTRRMNIRTQAPLAVAPAATPHSVGYPPEPAANNFSAPEDPAEKKPANTPQKKDQKPKQNGSSDAKKKSNQQEENRGLFGRFRR
jgi:membrane-associated protease RseP (regulator of RpoE activity)